MTPNTGIGPRTFDDRGAYEFQPPDYPPIPALTVTPATGLAPLTVTANASASTDIDKTPIATLHVQLRRRDEHRAADGRDGDAHLLCSRLLHGHGHRHRHSRPQQLHHLAGDRQRLAAKRHLGGVSELGRRAAGCHCRRVSLDRSGCHQDRDLQLRLGRRD